MKTRRFVIYRRRCQCCDGWGVLFVDAPDPKQPPREVRCNKCAGTGIVNKAVSIGDSIYEFDVLIGKEAPA